MTVGVVLGNQNSNIWVFGDLGLTGADTLKRIVLVSSDN